VVLGLVLFYLLLYLQAGNSQVILVSTSQQLINDEVENEIEIQLDATKKRSCCKGYCQFKIDFVENDTIALALINEYGPEHFIVLNQKNITVMVYNAGSVL
jgi:histidinol dehydrogenase